METAERHGSVVILANDPDADRLANHKQWLKWTMFLIEWMVFVVQMQQTNEGNRNVAIEWKQM